VHSVLGEVDAERKRPAGTQHQHCKVLKGREHPQRRQRLQGLNDYKERFSAYISVVRGRKGSNALPLFIDDVCILSASCVLDYINFDVFVDAEEDSEVVIIGASAFQSVMNSNVYVECYAYKMIAESFSM
jgi:hypothetical protein